MTLRQIIDWMEVHYNNWVGLINGDLSLLDMPFDSIFWGLMLLAWLAIGSLYLFGLALSYLEGGRTGADEDN